VLSVALQGARLSEETLTRKTSSTYEHRHEEE
jgi:hypothetical protein